MLGLRFENGRRDFASFVQERIAANRAFIRGHLIPDPIQANPGNGTTTICHKKQTTLHKRQHNEIFFCFFEKSRTCSQNWDLETHPPACNMWIAVGICVGICVGRSDKQKRNTITTNKDCSVKQISMQRWRKMRMKNLSCDKNHKIHDRHKFNPCQR